MYAHSDGMRRLALASVLFTIPACATAVTDPPGSAAAPTSLRERLADTTQLQVTAPASGGQITVERHVAEGWEPSLIAFGIENGELLVSAAADGVTVEGIQVSFAPFALPDGVFTGHEAQLTNVRLDLAHPTTVPAVWTTDDELTIQADLELALQWQLQLDGGAPTSLGAPELPRVPVTITLTGDGSHVAADVTARAPGEVWAWAGLVRLSEFQLDATAALR